MDTKNSSGYNPFNFFFSPVVICFAGIVALLFFLSFDILSVASEYLYFSTEIGIILISAAIYFSAFKGKRWDDPPEKVDNIPKPDWKRFSKELFISFILLGLTLSAVWIYMGITQELNLRHWLKRGAWFLYYIGIFTVSVIIISRYIRYVNYKALVTADITIIFFLCFYEMLLLAHGTGWEYNNTVIGWVLGVPLDNILFIYPVAPALSMIFYSVVSRHINDLKAFWLINLILLPCSAVVELIGIYPLNLWRIYNDQSILPMGKTNLEEFLYYILFQFLSIVLYAFFIKNFKTPVPKNL